MIKKVIVLTPRYAAYDKVIKKKQERGSKWNTR